jgi:aminoglycoside phosphotransferase (APT) family kinase protein
MPTLPSPFAVGRTAEIFSWQNGTILKLYREWCPAHWVEYEARVAAIVTQAGVPAPRAYDIVEVEGRRGLVYERVNGVSMLSQMTRQPLKLAAFGRTLADLHLEMHRHAVTELPAQSDQLEYSLKAAKNLPDDLRAAALQALGRLPKGDRLCHGDFHPDNVLMTSKGPIIIDWMTANRGEPWADVARTHLLLTLGRPTGNAAARWLVLVGRRAFYGGYMNRYQSAVPDEARQLHRWIPVMAAARLNEEISHERQALLDILRQGFKDSQSGGEDR